MAGCGERRGEASYRSMVAIAVAGVLLLGYVAEIEIRLCRFPNDTRPDCVLPQDVCMRRWGQVGGCARSEGR